MTWTFWMAVVVVILTAAALVKRRFIRQGSS